MNDNETCMKINIENEKRFSSVEKTLAVIESNLKNIEVTIKQINNDVIALQDKVSRINIDMAGGTKDMEWLKKLLFMLAGAAPPLAMHFLSGVIK